MKSQKNLNSFFYKHVPDYLLSIVIGLMVLSVSANVSAAEYVYINDHLRVGVRSEPVSGVPPINVVFTGMRLEEHERTAGYVRITTDKGISGWIKEIYVTKKAPAIIQLNVFQAKYDKLNKEFIKRNDTTVVLEKENKVLNDQVNEFKKEQREWLKERVELILSQNKESFWIWILTIIVLISMSFVAGVFWNKTQVTKRLGGLRI